MDSVYSVTGRGWTAGSGWSYREDLEEVLTDKPQEAAAEIAESYAEGLVNCDNYYIELWQDDIVVAEAWCKELE